MKKRAFALAMTSVLAFGLLTGCFGSGSTQSPSPVPSESSGPSPEIAPSVSPSRDVDKPRVNIAMLHGPTGMGAAKLMADNEAGVTVNGYDIAVYDESHEVAGALTTETADIAVLDANAAAALYNRTDGGIRLVAISACGGLELLQSGNGVALAGLSELIGQTVYAAGQGTFVEYALRYLLGEGEVTVQWVSDEEAEEKLLSGEAKFAALAYPASATARNMEENNIRRVLDLAEEWEAACEDGALIRECIVVRTAFAEENPQVVRDFLEEYEASMTYITDIRNLAISSDLNPAILVEKYADTAVGIEELPQVLTVVSGVKDLRDTIQSYYETLYAIDPASIGGGIPDDAFYFQ